MYFRNTTSLHIDMWQCRLQTCYFIKSKIMYYCSEVPANFKDTFPLFFTEVFDYYNLRNILLQQEEGKQQKL